MHRLLHQITRILTAGVVLIMLFGLWPSGMFGAARADCAACSSCDAPLSAANPVMRTVMRGESSLARFGLAFDMVARLPGGSLGLPGEPIVWLITLTNTSGTTINDVMITDKLRDELQIDSVHASHGDVAISERMVVYTLDAIPPNEQVRVTLNTTVTRGPVDGLLQNQAVLVVEGPNGPLTQTVTTEVYTPTGLPPTGYRPQADLPPYDAIPFSLLALFAALAVGMTALYVYHRGQRI